MVLSPLDELRDNIDAEIGGRRYSIRWPWKPLDLVQAFLPGTLTMLCARPGRGKSMLLLQFLWNAYERGDPVGGLFLEDGAAYHLRRALAQKTGKRDILDMAWTARNPELAMELFDSHAPFLEGLLLSGAVQSPPRDKPVNFESVLAWIAKEATAGKKLIAVDPITILDAQGERDLWRGQGKFIADAKNIAEANDCALFFVTHPRLPPSGVVVPNLENMAGSQGFNRFCATAFWLHDHALETTRVDDGLCQGRAVPHAPIFGEVLGREVQHNRTMRLEKGRNSSVPEKTRWAFQWNVGDFKFECLGRAIE